MSDTSSPVFPESELLSISTHLEDGLIPPPAPPPPLFPSLAPCVPYVSSSYPLDYQQQLSPFQSALGLVPDPDGQRNAQTDAGERKEVSREDRDPSARERTRRKTSRPLRFDAEFLPAKPYSPPICVGCRKSSQSRDQYSVLEAGSPTSSTSSSLHPSTSLSPPVVPAPSRKRKSDVDTPYIPFPAAQNPKTSKPVKPRKKKNDPEEQTSTSDATFQPSTSTRQITAPRVSQACRSCRSRKTRCSGIPEGGSCAQCEKGRFICALDARGSNDRAAASRRKRIAEDALAAGGSSTSPVASFSVPSHTLPSLVPQPPSTKPSKPLQLNSPEPPRSSSPSLFPPKQHHFPPLFLPKIEPIRLAPLALLPPPPPPQSPSNSRVPIGNGNFWIFYSDTPGVLQIEDLPDGSTKTTGGRRQGLMMLARFEETGSYGELNFESFTEDVGVFSETDQRFGSFLWVEQELTTN
ncbi:hypothetical protein BDY24DRAFT_432010 [Mrakia frigida]|uniref:Zn(II)2Cys6 transcription factor domain-containing protein n=1 Tax=Mrakia frigida TaxID=29902 RepID=UPI003FCBF881